MSVTTKKLRVLVIEDDVETASMLAEWLNVNGFNAMVAHSRDDASILLKNFAPNFILLDYWMPGMSASDFVHRCRIVLPLTKIIVITAADQIKTIAKIVSADLFLGKPINFETLAGILNSPP